MDEDGIVSYYDFLFSQAVSEYLWSSDFVQALWFNAINACRMSIIKWKAWLMASKILKSN